LFGKPRDLENTPEPALPVWAPMPVVDVVVDPAGQATLTVDGDPFRVPEVGVFPRDLLWFFLRHVSACLGSVYQLRIHEPGCPPYIEHIDAAAHLAIDPPSVVPRRACQATFEPASTVASDTGVGIGAFSSQATPEPAPTVARRARVSQW
jgi:hypothetical protein